MKTIVFTDIILGHYLEYTHHIYMGALERLNEEFVFVIPDQFNEVKDKYVWPDTDNISFDFISNKERNYCLPPSPLKAAFYKSKYIRKKCKIHRPDRLILLNLSAAIPFLPFFLPSGIKLKGVLYKIYRYGNLSTIRLNLEKIRYNIMAHHNKIEKILILNDQDSAEYFNTYYHTDKFRFLPDPVPDIDVTQLKNLRDELAIPKNKRIFLLFGALSERKGIFQLLDSVNLMNKEEKEKISLVFAGKVEERIEERFLERITQINNEVNIRIFNQFCSYDLLYNLCYTCDVILAPYFNPEMSSGVIGYAAKFKKIVIGTGKGLLGFLINKNHLGITIDEVSGSSLYSAMFREIEYIENDYSLQNSIVNFTNIILSNE